MSPTDHINNIKFSTDGTSLFISSEFGDSKVHQLTNAGLTIGKKYVHEFGTSAVTWASNTLFISGDGLGDLHLWDIRSHTQTTLNSKHRDRVVGLDAKDYLVCSGDNENLVQVWDYRRLKRPLFTIKKHKSAIRAIAFCPWQSNLLATGGASGDNRILVHDTMTGNLITEAFVGKQVCALQWSHCYQELLSGQAGKHQMTIWQYEKQHLTLVNNIEGHKYRTLHLATSPDGQTIASMGDDETLKFWKCFTKTPGMKPVGARTKRLEPTIR